MSSQRDSGVTLWRFGQALMGGYGIQWMVFAAFIFGLLGAIYAATHAMAPLGRGMLAISMASYAAACAFLAMPVAAAQLWVQQGRHPLLHLAPGGPARLRALLWCVALLAAVAFVPALMLRVFVTAMDGHWTDAATTLGSADARVWLLWALYLLGAAALILFAACSLRVPLAFACAPVYMMGMQASYRNWWLAVTICAVFMGLPWLSRRLTGNPLQRRPRMLDDRVFAVSGPLVYPPLFESWRAHRLRRAIGVPPKARATALALLSNDSMAMLSVLTTLFLAFGIAFIQPISPSWWGAPTSFFFGILAAFVAMPGPVTLTSVWLLPVGMQRGKLGETLVAVWMHRVRTRLMIGVTIAMTVLLLMHWIDPAWPAARTNMYGERSLLEKLIWAPLGMAVAWHGLAYVMCTLLVVSPRFVERTSLRVFPALLFLATPVVALAGMFLTTGLATRWHQAPSGFTIYCGLFGFVLPGAAWLLLRTRRTAWQRADVAAIAAGMADWSRRTYGAMALEIDVKRSHPRA